MSYGGGYGQSGYGQSNPYGGRQDPYGQRPDPYSQQQPPRRDPYGQQQQQPPRRDPYGQQQQPPPRQDPYGQQQPPRRDPYGQQQPPRRDPYGQQPPPRQDPYGQQQQPPPRQDPYGQQPQQQARPQRPAQANSYGDVEMGAVKPQQSYPPPAQEPPYDAPPPAYGGADILDECRKINNGTEDIERKLASLENAQRAALNETTVEDSRAAGEVDKLNSEIMNEYRVLLDKMKYIKKKPGAGSDLNSKHIGLSDRKLQASRQRYLQVEASYRNRTREQAARQFRIACPNATEDEVRQATENPEGHVFADALMNSDRRGQSSRILGAVRQRHEAIQKIEQQMIELARMFEDMERMVVEQEVMVERVEQGAVETHENVEQGNVELTGAVDKARAARRKKWICFGICVALILIIVIIILAYGATQGWFKSDKPAPAAGQ